MPLEICNIATRPERGNDDRASSRSDGMGERAASTLFAASFLCLVLLVVLGSCWGKKQGSVLKPSVQPSVQPSKPMVIFETNVVERLQNVCSCLDPRCIMKVKQLLSLEHPPASEQSEKMNLLLEFMAALTSLKTSLNAAQMLAAGRLVENLISVRRVGGRLMLVSRVRHSLSVENALSALVQKSDDIRLLIKSGMKLGEAGVRTIDTENKITFVMLNQNLTAHLQSIVWHGKEYAAFSDARHPLRMLEDVDVPLSTWISICVDSALQLKIKELECFEPWELAFFGLRCAERFREAKNEHVNGD